MHLVPEYIAAGILGVTGILAMFGAMKVYSRVPIVGGGALLAGAVAYLWLIISDYNPEYRWIWYAASHGLMIWQVGIVGRNIKDFALIAALIGATGFCAPSVIEFVGELSVGSWLLFALFAVLVVAAFGVLFFSSAAVVWRAWAVPLLYAVHFIAFIGYGVVLALGPSMGDVMDEIVERWLYFGLDMFGKVLPVFLAIFAEWVLLSHGIDDRDVMVEKTHRAGVITREAAHKTGNVTVLLTKE